MRVSRRLQSVDSVFGFGSLVLLVCLLQLRDVQALEWLAVPLAFAYANLAEYFGHRFPMHRPFPGLGPVYKRHAGQHHRFFTDEAMLVESRRDFRALLFPPMLVIFFFGLFGVPVLTGLPYGHVETKVLLPVGAKVDLAVQERDAMLVWGHLD